MGKQNIVITPFEKSSFPEGLLKHFLKIIGIPETEHNKFNFNIKKSIYFDGTNQGLSPKGLKIAFLCRDLAKGPLDYSLEIFLNKYLGNLIVKDFFESYGLFGSKEERVKFLSKFENTNKKIAKEFLNREVLFKDPIEEEGSSPKFSLEDVIKYIVYIGFKLDKRLSDIENMLKNMSNEKK